MLSIFIFYVGIFIILEWIYLWIAEKKGIFDRFNDRSSHTTLPIRGAGIIFPIAYFLPYCFGINPKQNIPMLIGLFLISIISFQDDIRSVLVKWRMLFHFSSVSLVLWQLGLFEINIIYLVSAFVLMVGVINAYNFMDGINGITAIYSIISVGTLFYISENLYHINETPIFLSLLASLAVFSFLNVRKVTKCFSGDVGSISVAFILTFLLLKLMLVSSNYLWILLLAVFGIDTLVTIILRIIRKENILQAHRSHFYQFLANEKKIAHVTISLLYGIIQLVMNIILITQPSFISLICFFAITVIYLIARWVMEGKERLLVKYNLIPV